VNGWFLLSLVSGMVLGIVFGIFVITWMMEHYPEPLWGFFFGLVMSSAILIGKHIKKWDFGKIIGLVGGIGIALFISMVTPSEGSSHPLYIFLAGMIAISAFILPGVSGSFMLLLMGMYTLIIPSLKSIMTNFDASSIYIIGIFALGCIVGIAWFSRLLSWLFEHYRDNTFVVLTGFLIGSLYKIWPWRNIDLVVDKMSGVVSNIVSPENWSSIDPESVKILKEVNVLPNNYWMGEPKILGTVVAIAFGFFIVLWMEHKNKNASLS